VLSHTKSDRVAILTKVRIYSAQSSIDRQTPSRAHPNRAQASVFAVSGGKG
jgi:hypothetical protein